MSRHSAPFRLTAFVMQNTYKYKIILPCNLGNLIHRLYINLIMCSVMGKGFIGFDLPGNKLQLHIIRTKFFYWTKFQGGSKWKILGVHIILFISYNSMNLKKNRLVKTRWKNNFNSQKITIPFPNFAIDFVCVPK